MSGGRCGCLRRQRSRATYEQRARGRRARGDVRACPSLLRVRSLEAADRRHRQGHRLTVGQDDFEPQAHRLAAQERSHNDLTLSPALIMFDRQPTRCIMLMLVNSTLKCFTCRRSAGRPSR